MCVRAAALTFGRVHHLAVDGRGDDGLGQVLQVAAQAVTQHRQLQLLQVRGGRRLCSGTRRDTRLSSAALKHNWESAEAWFSLSASVSQEEVDKLC